MSIPNPPSSEVARFATLPRAALAALLVPWDLHLTHVPGTASIPGSFWGEPEAGLIRNQLYVRDDTPVHSALHEACHYICMDGTRRARLHTNAGGNDLEECAVCYLQILLADRLAGYDRERMFHDMDAWGYSFRLGSARAWFEHDAQDAREFLAAHGLLDGADLRSTARRGATR